MPKFYILHGPSNNTYDEFVGFQPVSSTKYESVVEAEAVIEEQMKKLPYANKANFHICVAQ